MWNSAYPEYHLGRTGFDQSTLGPVSTSMGDRLRVGKPSRYVTSHLGQLSLPSLRRLAYRPVWLELMRGVFTCVG